MKADAAKLAKKFKWWWRSCPDFTLLPNGPTRDNGSDGSVWWKQGEETAAYDYELVRRRLRDKKLPPFSELDPFAQSHLINARPN